MTFDTRSLQCSNYLIAREHKPSTVKQQLSENGNKTQAEARTKQDKQDRVKEIKKLIQRC